MSVELKHKTKALIQYIIGIALFILFQVAMALLSVNNLSNLGGICAAFQYAVCLFLVRTNKRKGIITAMILLAFSLLNIVRVIIVGVDYLPYAGLFNVLFYMVTIAWLASIFARQDKAAVTDIVTGLLNRRGLYQYLISLIEDEKPFYLVNLEIANFKLLNDSYGHVCGDTILKKVTKLLQDYFGEKGTVIRSGGSEFIIILKYSENAEKDTNNVLQLLAQKIVLSEENDVLDCYLSVYAGISSYPADSSNYEELINYADMAVVEAARKNSPVAVAFEPCMEEASKRQMELEHLIKEGLENDYFYLEYQPQYKLDGKRLRGFETLIRMKLPDGSIVSPGEFIPVAEKGKHIISIDDYVLRRAMNEFKGIVANNNPDLIVSVNVSAKNIGTLDFPDRIGKILAETGYPAKNLEIEITEYCMVQSIKITVENITKLRAMGIQVALDDFGTGYTSLNYLSQMPVNLLKIDKSLIDDIEQNRQKCEFVKAIVAMGHIMGCEVISEGVENTMQLSKLKDNNCDFIQGYVWGKPLAYDTATALATE
ncbi:MAG: putative bifunctional diguanylate cyclase/phosphodiesterase [Oscillospiraceae bacterium]